MTFHGSPRANDRVMHHVHESPAIMTGSAGVAGCRRAVRRLSSAYNGFVGEGREAFWGEAIFVLHEHDTIEAAHHVPSWVATGAVHRRRDRHRSGLRLLHVRAAASRHARQRTRRPLPVRSIEQVVCSTSCTTGCSSSRLGRSATACGSRGDGAIIDGVGPDGVAAATRDVAFRAAGLQTGYVYHYAFAMVIGVVLLVGWYLLLRLIRRGRRSWLAGPSCRSSHSCRSSEPRSSY